jgi:predicted nuclease of restriction endonuclease-like (RecB) superfamily
MKNDESTHARNNGSLDLSPKYAELLTELKAQICSARARAALSVNRELVLLYWRIGKQILESQRQEGWGSKVVDRLSRDLRVAFPEMKGFSPRNLKYIRAFADAYPSESFVQEVLAQITWYHNITLLDKIKDPAEREFYILKTIEHGWSRNVLVHQIERDLYHRQGKAIANFDRTLPAPQSKLALQILKDPYNFDFLSLNEVVQERELERALIHHLFLPIGIRKIIVTVHCAVDMPPLLVIGEAARNLDGEPYVDKRAVL